MKDITLAGLNNLLSSYATRLVLYGVLFGVKFEIALDHMGTSDRNCLDHRHLCPYNGPKIGKNCYYIKIK